MKKHLIAHTATTKTALQQLNDLGSQLTLFVINEQEQLVGTLTDGDIRRGLLNDLSIQMEVQAFMHTSFRFLRQHQYDLAKITAFRERKIYLIPLLDENNRILRIIDLSQKRSLIPADAVIMAGGRGSRLMPLTANTPKPLLEIGGQPIIEYNVDRLNLFGINRLYLSVKYLGEQLENYFQNGEKKDMSIQYVWEDQPLGTIGAVGLVKDFAHPHVLVMNSDLLTNIDFEDFYQAFIQQGADMAVATIPYEVKIPYGVLETAGERVVALKEKPTYTYYSNAGIYFLNQTAIDRIPKNEFFNATDLMEALMAEGKKVIHYPIIGYWLDIGKHEDFKRAEEEVGHIQW